MSEGRPSGAASGESGGRVDFDPLVVCSIARDATLEQEGVAALAATLPEKVRGALRARVPGVSVATEADALAVDVHVAVGYGTHLPALAQHVKDAVAARLAALTGLRVTEVVVHVDKVMADAP